MLGGAFLGTVAAESLEDAKKDGEFIYGKDDLFALIINPAEEDSIGSFNTRLA